MLLAGSGSTLPAALAVTVPTVLPGDITNSRTKTAGAMSQSIRPAATVHACGWLTGLADISPGRSSPTCTEGSVSATTVVVSRQ